MGLLPAQMQVSLHPRRGFWKLTLHRHWLCWNRKSELWRWSRQRSWPRVMKLKKELRLLHLRVGRNGFSSPLYSQVYSTLNSGTKVLQIFWFYMIFHPFCSLLGIAGGGAGLVSKHRKVHGLANISATYATNFAIVTGCYCGNFFFIVWCIGIFM